MTRCRCACKVKMRRVPATNVEVVKKCVTYSRCVFVAHASYYVVMSSVCRLYHIFTHYLINGTIFGEGVGGKVIELKIDIDFLYNFEI